MLTLHAAEGCTSCFKPDLCVSIYILGQRLDLYYDSSYDAHFIKLRWPPNAGSVCCFNRLIGALYHYF